MAGEGMANAATMAINPAMASDRVFMGHLLLGVLGSWRPEL
jgi:hypothetical protein